MARLIDDVRSARAFDMPWWVPDALAGKWGAHARQVMHFVKTMESPVLLIDNVAEADQRATAEQIFGKHGRN